MEGSKLILTKDKKLAVLVDDLFKVLKNRKQEIQRNYVLNNKKRFRADKGNTAYAELQAKREELNFIIKQLKDGLQE